VYVPAARKHDPPSVMLLYAEPNESPPHDKQAAIAPDVASFDSKRAFIWV
jgi:hypothetical protein